MVPILERIDKGVKIINPKITTKGLEYLEENSILQKTKNFLKDVADMFSIIETAKENGLNPFAYLTYIFRNAPNWNIKNDVNALQNLLPDFVPEDLKMPTAS